MLIPTCGRCCSVKEALRADHPTCLHIHLDACKSRPFELMFEALHAPKCLDYLYTGHVQIGLSRFNYELRTRHAAAT
jgi:hypothetical protein